MIEHAILDFTTLAMLMWLGLMPLDTLGYAAKLLLALGVFSTVLAGRFRRRLGGAAPERAPRGRHDALSRPSARQRAPVLPVLIVRPAIRR